MLKPKPLAVLEAQVALWNRNHGIGTPVHYFPVIGSQGFRQTRTKSAASVLSQHTAVVWVEGETGCVALDACQVCPGPGQCAAYDWEERQKQQAAELAQAEQAGTLLEPEPEHQAEPTPPAGIPNRFLVSVQGKYYHVVRPALNMSADDALELAAYLVALAEPFASRKFAAVLEAVLNS